MCALTSASKYAENDCRYENAVEALCWLADVKSNTAAGAPLVLASAGADGILRIWRVAAAGHLMCTLEGAVGSLETVRAMSTDEMRAHLVMCDSSGHVKVWDTANINVTSPQTTFQSFRVVRSRVASGPFDRLVCAACVKCGCCSSARHLAQPPCECHVLLSNVSASM
jgi:WD40 repeat protein